MLELTLSFLSFSRRRVDHAPPFAGFLAHIVGVTGILINPKPHVRVSEFFTLSPEIFPASCCHLRHKQLRLCN